MSTKTTIKRVALVAAVALTLGGFSAVSASATSGTTITQVVGTGDGGVGGVAGPANSLQVTITPDSTLSTLADYVTVTGGTITSADTNTTIAANGLSARTAGTVVLTISTPAAGSLVITAYDAVTASTFASAASVSKTITISAAGISGVYSAAKSSVYIAKGETNTAVSSDATVIALGTKPSDHDSATATIQVIYRDGNGSNITNDSITATITGPGVINGVKDSGTILPAVGDAVYAANNYATSVTSQNGAATFVVFPNGQTGVATVTIKNTAGTILGTKTLTFTGSTPASIKVKNLHTYVSNAATADTAFAYNVYDASGNEIKVLASDKVPTAAVATGVTAAGSVTCDNLYDADNGYFTCAVAASSATSASTKDFVDAYTFTAVTGVTATASVNYVQPVVASLTIAGPDSAAPGDKITYTLTAKNANGNPIPDAKYAPGTFIASVSPSANLVSSPFGAGASDTITTVAGVATSSTYAPYGGTLSITWTLAGTTAGVATANLAKTLTTTTVAATTTIAGSQDSALAVDAANAATDAANAAAEEASNATEAASEALAAVNALATTVASLIAGIKSQLTALTSLVKKLQK